MVAHAGSALTGPARRGAVLPPGAVRRLSTDMVAIGAADDVRAAVALPFAGGRALSLSFTASPQTQTAAHRLGRTPSGWIVTRVTGGLSSLVETARDDLTISLQHTGGATVSVDVWVY